MYGKQFSQDTTNFVASTHIHQQYNVGGRRHRIFGIMLIEASFLAGEEVVFLMMVKTHFFITILNLELSNVSNLAFDLVGQNLYFSCIVSLFS